MLTAGSMLKETRIEKGLSLEQIASATKISAPYLSALENDEYERFPSSVYARGFLQNYAKYLGMDVEKVIALYRRSVSNSQISSEVKDTAHKINSPKFILTPGVFLIISVVILVISTLGYLIYQFYNFQKPPLLTVDQPKNAAVVNSPSIEVKGKTEIGMFITINDEAVKVGADGSFTSSIGLTKGSNTLIVKARHPDNIGKEAIMTITVEYVPEEKVEGTETEVVEPPAVPVALDLSVSILEESAWLEISIDDAQVFASVAPPNSNYTYTASQSLYVRTGKVSSTSIIVNGENRVPFSESGGVASIECELVENQVNCRKP